MKLARLGLVLTLAASGTAVADNAAPGDVAKFVAFFDKVVDAAVTNKDSCPKMATAVNAVIDDNTALLAMAKDSRSKGKTLPQDAKDHITASAKRLIPAMQACSKDDGVMSAFKRLDMK